MGDAQQLPSQQPLDLPVSDFDVTPWYSTSQSNPEFEFADSVLNLDSETPTFGSFQNKLFQASNAKGSLGGQRHSYNTAPPALGRPTTAPNLRAYYSDNQVGSMRYGDIDEFSTSSGRNFEKFQGSSVVNPRQIMVMIQNSRSKTNT
jgi:hypothetical protein